MSGNVGQNGHLDAKKSVQEKKSLATFPGEGIIQAPATSALFEG
jgi:hypothetical protein